MVWKDMALMRAFMGKVLRLEVSSSPLPGKVFIVVLPVPQAILRWVKPTAYTAIVLMEIMRVYMEPIMVQMGMGFWGFLQALPEMVYWETRPGTMVPVLRG